MDHHLGNHVERRTVQEFMRGRIYLSPQQTQKLWWLVMGNQSKSNEEELVTENQFYAAMHIARLHQNKYKPHCNLSLLYALPKCLTARRIQNVRHNVRMDNISGDVEDLKTEAASQPPPAAASRISGRMSGRVSVSSANPHAAKMVMDVNLDTKIGTMAELKIVAGIRSPRKKKLPGTHSMDVLSGIDWNISKTDIEKYRKWFVKADQNNDGFIDGEEGRKFFLKSKVSKDELAKIWYVRK